MALKVPAPPSAGRLRASSAAGGGYQRGKSPSNKSARLRTLPQSLQMAATDARPRPLIERRVVRRQVMVPPHDDPKNVVMSEDGQISATDLDDDAPNQRNIVLALHVMVGIHSWIPGGDSPGAHQDILELGACNCNSEEITGLAGSGVEIGWYISSGVATPLRAAESSALGQLRPGSWLLPRRLECGSRPSALRRGGAA